METEIEFIRKDLIKLKRDIELIKRALISKRNVGNRDLELTDWAKKELENARKTPESEYVPLEEVKKKILKNGIFH